MLAIYRRQSFLLLDISSICKDSGDAVQQLFCMLHTQIRNGIKHLRVAFYVLIYDFFVRIFYLPGFATVGFIDHYQRESVGT